ncbi:HlyD family secretion protein (plasmid) [Rhizobium sp. CIAT894]|nr:HlyD family secretion protein [Rhizobium sp. CIAT894]
MAPSDYRLAVPLSAETASCTAESILARRSGRSLSIYRAILLFVAAAFGSLPLVTIPVSMQSVGTIRPIVEKTPLIAPVSGRISRVLAFENDVVAKGKEIIAFDDHVIEEKLSGVLADIHAKSDLAHDFQTLISSGARLSVSPPLQTESAMAERVHFLNLLRENQNARSNAAAELDRAKRLVSAAAAPAKTVDEKAFALQNIEVQGEILVRRKTADWNQKLLDANLSLKELTATLHQLEHERDLHRIRAPVSGALEQFSGLAHGSYVQSGQTVGWISPNDDLVAEIYVSPNDIGFVQPGQPVRLQVDAFNYNQWGVIKARVVEVAQDFTLHDGNPVFKVQCALSRSELALKSGAIGHLKKGMTVRARFLLANRTLLQLLYDEADDWLNPMLAGR